MTSALANQPGREPCTILELYIPFCQLRYGETNSAGTCPAVLGTDSERKCYNTLKTCAVPDSFAPADMLLRFSTAQQRIPPRERIRPTIVNVDDAPRRLAPAKGLGEGAEARVTLLDHPWPDYWVDPYRDERDYDPMERGTFWGKFIARNPYYRGERMRLLTGYLDENGIFHENTSREYIIDNIKGPDSDGRVTVIGTDVFRLLSKDRSLVPAPSNGELAAGIDESATSFTLAPTGIGDEEYPASFRCVIGNEGFDVTRSGDACTITQRGLYRGLSEHEAEDTVQVVRRFTGQQVHEIARDIIVEAQPRLEEWIPWSSWEAEAQAFLPRLYEADIVEPTGVNELLAELMDSVPVLFWPDERERRIQMQAIKAPPVDTPVLNDAEHYLADSLSKEERPKDRVDSVLVHFGMLDPTEDKDDPSNYSQAVFMISPEARQRYGTQQYREVFSRWIGRFAKASAQDLAELYIRRFRETPLALSFDLDAKHADLWTGGVFRALTRLLQDETGAMASRNFQVIEAYEAEPGHRIEYEAHSYDWWIDEDDPDEEVQVIISADDMNVNLRAAYDSEYAEVRPNIRVIIEEGVLIGSSSATLPAIDVGDWPTGNEQPNIRIDIYGRIQGAGGYGGNALDNDRSGEDGGTSLYTRFPISINNQGRIWSGGGGGGAGGYFQTVSPPNFFYQYGGGGGGGAGQDFGLGGAGAEADTDSESGSPGTLNSGGAGGAPDGSGGYGGNGGDPGENGAKGGDSAVSGGAGGVAGFYLDGESYVTWVNSNGDTTSDRGDVRGRVA